MNYLKWIGTIIVLVGISFTSYNLYPYNLYLGLIGSFLWTLAGYYQDDKPLFLVEFIAVLFYTSGLYHYHHIS